jgi:KTSC domain
MPREIVGSTVVAAVNYDELRQQLDIELTTGRIYRYLDVPPEVYEAFMAAESKGRYYNDHIRDVYLYERLGRS